MLLKLFKGLQESARETIAVVAGRPYSTVGVTPILDPVPDVFGLNTLTGIKDYVDANVDSLVLPELMLHVLSPTCVMLVSKLVGGFEQRKSYLRAEFGQEGFPFGAFIEHENFIIGLHSRFLETDDRDEVLQYVGGFSETASKDYEDNGLNQRTTVKKGLSGARVEGVVVKNPVTLMPFRTFAEVHQPQSSFVFRIRPSKDGVPPTCGLFESDGGAWELEAIANIAQWLREKVPGVTVIA